MGAAVAVLCLFGGERSQRFLASPEPLVTMDVPLPGSDVGVVHAK